MTSGIDFETKIVAKFEAPAMLKKELGAKGWRGEVISMSGITDCYQPIEGELRITRGCLEVMAACRQPVGIVTKNKMVLRDLDLLTALAQHRAASVAVSVTTLDRSLSMKMEPRASSPADRLDTIRRLRDAGIPVGAMIAPVIPGLNDTEIPDLLAAVAEAGASWAGYVMLRLPWQIKSLFEQWLKEHFPLRAERVLSGVRSTRGGELYKAEFGKRMRGEGPMAEQVSQLFEVYKKRLGLETRGVRLSSDAFRRPGDSTQMSLFG